MKQFRVNKITTIFRGKTCEPFKVRTWEYCFFILLEVFDYVWLLTWQMARHPYASCRRTQGLDSYFRRATYNVPSSDLNKAKQKQKEQSVTFPFIKYLVFCINLSSIFSSLIYSVGTRVHFLNSSVAFTV